VVNLSNGRGCRGTGAPIGRCFSGEVREAMAARMYEVEMEYDAQHGRDRRTVCVCSDSFDGAIANARQQHFAGKNAVAMSVAVEIDRRAIAANLYASDLQRATA
jgi:hypothetical protein